MTKFELRQEYLKKRQSLMLEDVAHANDQIAANLWNLLTDKEINTLHTFLPQRNATEVNTWKIISIVRECFPKVQIAVPYIIPGTKEMQHYILKHDTPLIENRWRIPEPDPVQAQWITADELDAVLIPLLAFDMNGFRVGYGGGYYDRFLSQCRPNALKIGLSFFSSANKISDLDEYDVPMNVCITPDIIYNF
ncbi:5-formyltetrahydrofolate cyclo-ligase [Dyadobacter sp. CY326]|uniref:5-formyltetrahydrofolate cyclo-ligase n=1 Tax=Dyadobacter sp. CY326 TaxID=2907300 RepID=UPI001F416F9E|nr:5-formyltetrahydrofolate cyclo-ligase [Dyadobacter sp. CY326]MCE7067521.1 5-formyltetrahydrofolate cyclo-ligase [Dyadobacter sp. CY326]